MPTTMHWEPKASAPSVMMCGVFTAAELTEIFSAPASDGAKVATLGKGTSVGEMAYLAPNPDLRRHSTDIKVSQVCTTISFTPESLGMLSPECQHRFDRAFIQVLVRRLHAAHEALAHPRRIM